MGDILKEAIADAKAVRETALENAKMALQEAFTPQLKSMLSAKLKEDEMDSEDPEEMSYEDDEMGDEVPAEEGEHGDDEEAEEGYHEGEHGDDEEAEEGYHEGEHGDDEDDVDEELDLEAVIRELESELSEGDDEVEETVDEQDDAYDENADKPEGGEPMGEGEESDDDKEDVKEEEEGDDDKEDVDEEYDKSSGIGNSDNSVDKVSTSGIGKGGQEKAQKMESIQAELAEYKEAVSFLKDKLHEVNILNAKLLFTNKLFKEYALDNGQKLKVVETFDRAQTTREIKLVYSTLAEQFADNGSIVTKKSISESASASVGSTKPSEESRKVISEETQVANRFKKLAGLIK